MSNSVVGTHQLCSDVEKMVRTKLQRIAET